MSRKLLAVLMVIFFASALTAYLLGDYESLANQLWNLVPPFLAAIIGFITVKVYGINNPHAKAIGLMSIGVFFWFLGDFIWFILEYFYKINPFPSVADYFYLAAYPLLLIGLTLEVKSNKLDWTYCKVIASISLSLLFGIIVFYFGILRAYDPTEGLFNNVIALTYGVGDLILIIFTIIIFMVALGYHKGKLFLPWLYILTGFTFILAADILFAIYREEYENFTSIRNLDLGWIIGFLFIGFGFFSIRATLKEARKRLVG